MSSRTLAAALAAVAIGAAASPALAQTSADDRIASLEAQLRQKDAQLAEAEAYRRKQDERQAAQDERLAAMERRLAAVEQATPVATQTAAAPAANDRATVVASAPSREVPATEVAENGMTAPPVTVPYGPVGRALQKSGLMFDLTAASTSSRVSIGLTGDWSDNPPKTNARGETWVSTLRTNFAVSAPLNKSDTRTDIATLDGFASDFELKAGMSLYWRRINDPQDDGNALAIEARAVAACERTATAAEARATTDAAKEAARKARAACATADMTSTFIRTHLSARDETIYNDIALPDGAFAVGVEAQIGYREYKFIGAATGLPGEDEDVPWGFSAYYSYLPTSRSSLTGSVKYVSDMKAGKDGVVCPVGGGGPVVCATGALDAPKDREKLLTAVEWRQIVPLNKDWLISQVGFSAQAVYDQRSGEYSIDIPIYLVSDDKNGLTGGIRLGWESENHDVILGLFVASALSPRR